MKLAFGTRIDIVHQSDMDDSWTTLIPIPLNSGSKGHLEVEGYRGNLCIVSID